MPFANRKQEGVGLLCRGEDFASPEKLATISCCAEDSRFRGAIFHTPAPRQV
jgi:hypothetical protein